MKADHDFKDTLVQICRELNPKNILEWGPGKSTEIMYFECPNASIFTNEHSKKYYERAIALYSDMASIRYATGDEYISVSGKYDLIFVDGRQRVKCLIAAYLVLNQGGAIILHDAERERYQPGIKALLALGMKQTGTERTGVFKNEL